MIKGNVELAIFLMLLIVNILTYQSKCISIGSFMGREMNSDEVMKNPCSALKSYEKGAAIIFTIIGVLVKTYIASFIYRKVKKRFSQRSRKSFSQRSRKKYDRRKKR